MFACLAVPLINAVVGLQRVKTTLGSGLSCHLAAPHIQATYVFQVGKPRLLKRPREPGFRPKRVLNQPTSHLYLLWQSVRGRAPA